MAARPAARRALLAAFAASALLVAACGDDGDDGEGSSPDLESPAPVGSDPGDPGDEGDEGDVGSEGIGVEPCALVTEEEAEAAVGGVDLSATTDDSRSCVYDASQSGEIALAVVQIQVDPLGLAGGVALEDVAGAALGFLSEDADVEELDIADGAFMSTTSAVPMLMMGHGERLITISVFGSDDDGAAMTQLAELAAGRL